MSRYDFQFVSWVHSAPFQALSEFTAASWKWFLFFLGFSAFIATPVLTGHIFFTVFRPSRVVRYYALCRLLLIFCINRSPRVSLLSFIPFQPHLLKIAFDDWDFVFERRLIQLSLASWDSYSSGQSFAYNFLQIPPHGGHPCCSANGYGRHSPFGTSTL